jgi:hypothetical protein
MRALIGFHDCFHPASLHCLPEDFTIVFLVEDFRGAFPDSFKTFNAVPF